MTPGRRSSLVALALLGGVVASGVAQAQESLTVTVTHYALHGTTYAGTQTRPGVAACSWNIPLHSTIRFEDGRSYRCEDRGAGLGHAGWIDVWVGDVATARQLGRYTATVEVTRP